MIEQAHILEVGYQAHIDHQLLQLTKNRSYLVPLLQRYAYPHLFGIRTLHSLDEALQVKLTSRTLEAMNARDAIAFRRVAPHIMTDIEYMPRRANQKYTTLHPLLPIKRLDHLISEHPHSSREQQRPQQCETDPQTRKTLRHMG